MERVWSWWDTFQWSRTLELFIGISGAVALVRALVATDLFFLIFAIWFLESAHRMSKERADR